MIQNFLQKLGLHKNVANDVVPSRRRYARRSCDRCIGMIGENIYPISDWSMGGVLVDATPDQFSMAEEHEIMLKFKLSDQLLDVPQKARVVRKSHSTVAFEFTPLTKPIHDSLQTVIDDYVASQFASSHL